MLIIIPLLRSNCICSSMLIAFCPIFLKIDLQKYEYPLRPQWFIIRDFTCKKLSVKTPPSRLPLQRGSNDSGMATFFDHLLLYATDTSSRRRLLNNTKHCWREPFMSHLDSKDRTREYSENQILTNHIYRLSLNSLGEIWALCEPFDDVKRPFPGCARCACSLTPSPYPSQSVWRAFPPFSRPFVLPSRQFFRKFCR